MAQGVEPEVQGNNEFNKLRQALRSRKIGEALSLVEDDFELRRQIIDMLDIRGTLGVEDGQRVLELHSILSATDLSIASPTTTVCSQTKIPSRRDAGKSCQVEEEN